VGRSLDQAFRFEFANDVNEHMPEYVVQRVAMALNRRELSVNGRHILLLGLSCKKYTGDARESPSIHVANRLVHLGAAVRAVDPHVHPDQVPSGVERVELGDDELRNADLVVDHDAFDVARVAELAPYVLDTRNCTPRANVERL
jgi:UDP-N-acetyl-D-mannosaminuronate dehydrogenase